MSLSFFIWKVYFLYFCFFCCIWMQEFIIPVAVCMMIDKGYWPLTFDIKVWTVIAVSLLYIDKFTEDLCSLKPCILMFHMTFKTSVINPIAHRETTYTLSLTVIVSNLIPTTLSLTIKLLTFVLVIKLFTFVY